MANIIECDGCGARISAGHPLGMSGRVEPAMPGGPGQDGNFWWCETCAAIACAAVRGARRVPSDEERIREAMAGAEDHPGRIITR
jgi:hypothetical protein